MRAHYSRPTTAHAHAAYLRAAGVVAAVTGLSIADLTGQQSPWRPRRRRGSPNGFAREATIYLTVIHFDIRAAALARAIGRPRWKISRAVQRIELARDTPDLDVLLERMEAML